MTGHLSHLGHELDGRSSVANGRYFLIAQISGMIPFSGMELYSLEALSTWEIRNLRLGKLAPSSHKDTPVEGFTGSGFHLPRLHILQPLGAGDAVVELDVLVEVELFCHGLEVVQHFVLAGKHARDTEVEEVGVAVDKCLGIAGGTRVGIIAPYSTYFIGSFQDEVVFGAILGQLGSHTNAAVAGAEDDAIVNVWVRHEVYSFFGSDSGCFSRYLGVRGERGIGSCGFLRRGPAIHHAEFPR